MKSSSVRRLVFLCVITYFISYVTRTNFGAIVAEMVADTGYSKSLLSIALTGSFITYGTGQIISGIFGDRVQPRYLVAIGLVVTSLMNVIIPFCSSPFWMAAVWCVNGFAQAFMWPPIIKLLATSLEKEDYDRNCTKVSWGANVGTITIYLFSPLLILLASWKSVFFAAALCGVLGLLLWWKMCPIIPLSPRERSTSTNRTSDLFSPLLILIMVAIVLQGTLRDGITTWMPSFVAETFRLDEEVAILTGVILPIFSILSLWLAGLLYRKAFHNPLTCTGAIFGTGTLAALLLMLFYGKFAALSVVCTALLAGCMHGANLILVCFLPPLLAKNGNVSTVSGVLNACTYVGSAISTFAFPLVAENMGWETTLYVWLFVSLAGTILCLLGIPSWKRAQTR